MERSKMGRLASPVKEIRVIEFKKMPSRDLNIARFYKADQWTFYVLTKRGTLYTNARIGDDIFLHANYGTSSWIIRALRGLKLITPQQAAAHMLWEEDKRDLEDAKRDLRTLRRICNDYDTPVSKRQHKKLTGMIIDLERKVKYDD